MAENHNTANQPAPVPEPLPRTRALRGRSIRSAQDNVPRQALERRDPNRVNLALERARIAARIADDNRAKDILLLDLRQATALLDFFVIATSTSRRQSLAIASEIDAAMKKLGERKLGLEGSEEGRWILLDYGDFVVHIFSAEARMYYALEEIWGDAPRLDWQGSEPNTRAASAPATPEPAPATTERSTTGTNS
jgi:ribosome-associated protein